MTCPCQNARPAGGTAQLRGPGMKRTHCVVNTRTGEAVRCFRSKRTAAGVAKKLGSRYKVKSK